MDRSRPAASMIVRSLRIVPLTLALTSVALLGGPFFLSRPAASPGPVSVWTNHNDNARTGANLSETGLNGTTVNQSTFGRLFSQPVDGDVYAQPLVIPTVAIAGKGTHDVVYVATMNNRVYAFDAGDNRGSNAAPLWSVTFNSPPGVIAEPASDAATRTNIRNPGPVGIMGTPVIDQATGTMYLVARTKETSGVTRYVQRLHALDIRSGAERFGGPVEIQASVPGAGYDAVDGVITFNPLRQNQRAALALASGTVYVAWASIEDRDPYHGWLMAYDAASLNQLGAWCVTPNGSRAGIWQSGQGPVIDDLGNVYVMTGNGSMTVSTGGRDYGEALVKLSPVLDVLDWFTPDDWANLNTRDLDFGSAGALLVPDTSFLIGGGKTGRFYVLNRSSLGGLQTGNTQIVQNFDVTGGGHIHGSPVYWKGPSGPTVYVMGEQDYLKGYHFNGVSFDITPITKSTFKAPTGMPGGFLSVSADGSSAGSGIVWASMPAAADAESAVVPGILRAFDANDLTRELWNSQQNATRDPLGNYAKYAPPTVANGRVYMATFSNQIVVYGLLGSLPPPVGGSLVMSSAQSSAAANLTGIGTADWVSWPGLVRKATGGNQVSNVAIAASPYSSSSYNNDPRLITWSDGDIQATGSTQAGIFVNRVGSTLVLSAPADTTPRTLTLFVGGFNSTAYATAHLSDGSATDVIGPQFRSSGQYDVVHAISYHAASPGQRMTVQWSQFSGAGNVTLQAAALAVSATSPPGTPTNVAASDGTSSASVSVTWTAVAGATSYDVYRSSVAGSQGSLVGTVTASSFIDTAVTPNALYYYSVAARNSAGAGPLSVQDSGYARGAGGSGTLSASLLSASAVVDLTAAGTADWARWPGSDRKAGGGSQIAPYVVVGSATARTYSNDPRTVTWSDGTPTAMGTSNSGVYVAGIGSGFQLSIPADSTVRTLTLYLGGYNSTAQLTASLSDGSSASYSSPTTGATGQYSRTYQLTYSAASSAQTLLVQWKQVASSGTNANVTLQGAALATSATGSLIGNSLTPASPIDLTAAGTSDWAHWPGYDHKAAGGGQILPYVLLGSAGVKTYFNDPRTLMWSDGTPTAAGSDASGVYATGVGAGFQVTSPADLTLRTLTVYVGGWNSTGQLTASLSDGSAPLYVSPASSSTGQYDRAYQLTYKAAGATQTLVVQWKQIAGSGNVTLQAAALR